MSRLSKSTINRLVSEITALPSYRGWEFSYEYPGIFRLSRGDLLVSFTPDWDEAGILPIEVSDNDGNYYEEHSRSLSIPRAGLTGQKLIDLVIPTLDAIDAGQSGSRTPAQLEREIAILALKY